MSRPCCLLFLLLITGVTPATAQRPDPAIARTLHERLREDFRACDHPSMAVPQYRSYDPHRDLLHELGAMLRAPRDACPDTPGRAVAFLAAAVGDPIRPDADPDLLLLLETALRAGQGGPPDPIRAEALARMLWLVAAERDIPGWSAAEREAWLARPETVASLEARVAAAPTARSIWLLSGLLLDRNQPGYDPARAAALLEKSPEIHRGPVPLRLAALLTEGVHIAPDYVRAAKLFRREATGPSEREAAQRALLVIGRRAAAAARTQAERLSALAILAPASLDGLDDSRALYERLLARVRAPTDRSPLPADRIEWIEAELNFAFAYMLDMLPEETPRSTRPIIFHGLIGPDGRLVTVRLAQSSGVAARDHAVQSAYLSRGEVVDLSSIARGRAVWIVLPPVDPMFDFGAAWDRKKARCPACG